MRTKLETQSPEFKTKVLCKPTGLRPSLHSMLPEGAAFAKLFSSHGLVSFSYPHTTSGVV